MQRARRSKGRAVTRVTPVAPPPGLEGSRMRVGGRECAVLKFPLCAPSFPSSLSAAERAVALALIEGRTNAEIAAARKTSVRTVANQIVSAYRKLGVHSRRELVVAVVGAGGARRGPATRS